MSADSLANTVSGNISNTTETINSFNQQKIIPTGNQGEFAQLISQAPESNDNENASPQTEENTEPTPAQNGNSALEDAQAASIYTTLGQGATWGVLVIKTKNPVGSAYLLPESAVRDFSLYYFNKAPFLDLDNDFAEMLLRTGVTSGTTLLTTDIAGRISHRTKPPTPVRTVQLTAPLLYNSLTFGISEAEKKGIFGWSKPPTGPNGLPQYDSWGSFFERESRYGTAAGLTATIPYTTYSLYMNRHGGVLGWERFKLDPSQLGNLNTRPPITPTPTTPTIPQAKPGRLNPNLLGTPSNNTTIQVKPGTPPNHVPRNLQVRGAPLNAPIVSTPPNHRFPSIKPPTTPTTTRVPSNLQLRGAPVNAPINVKPPQIDLPRTGKIPIKPLKFVGETGLTFALPFAQYMTANAIVNPPISNPEADDVEGNTLALAEDWFKIAGNTVMDLSHQLSGPGNAAPIFDTEGNIVERPGGGSPLLPRFMPDTQARIDQNLERAGQHFDNILSGDPRSIPGHLSRLTFSLGTLALDGSFTSLSPTETAQLQANIQQDLAGISDIAIEGVVAFITDDESSEDDKPVVADGQLNTPPNTPGGNPPAGPNATVDADAYMLIPTEGGFLLATYKTTLVVNPSPPQTESESTTNPALQPAGIYNPAGIPLPVEQLTTPVPVPRVFPQPNDDPIPAPDLALADTTTATESPNTATNPAFNAAIEEVPELQQLTTAQFQQLSQEDQLKLVDRAIEYRNIPKHLQNKTSLFQYADSRQTSNTQRTQLQSAQLIEAANQARQEASAASLELSRARIEQLKASIAAQQQYNRAIEQYNQQLQQQINQRQALIKNPPPAAAPPVTYAPTQPQSAPTTPTLAESNAIVTPSTAPNQAGTKPLATPIPRYMVVPGHNNHPTLIENFADGRSKVIPFPLSANTPLTAQQDGTGYWMNVPDPSKIAGKLFLETLFFYGGLKMLNNGGPIQIPGGQTAPQGAPFQQPASAF